MLNKLEKVLAGMIVSLFKASKSKTTYKILGLFLILVCILIGASFYIHMEEMKAFERAKIVNIIGVTVDQESGIYIVQTPLIIDVKYNNPITIQNPENIKLELNIQASQKRFAHFLEQPDDRTIRLKYITHFGDQVETLNYPNEDSLLLNGAGIYNVDNELIDAKLPAPNSPMVFAFNQKITIAPAEPYPVIVEQRRSKEVKEYTIIFNKPVNDFAIEDVTVYEGLTSNFKKVDTEGRIYKIDTTMKGMVEQTITIRKGVCITDEGVPNSAGVLVPDGFYYVTGTKDTGIVISDAQEDANIAFYSDGKFLKDLTLGVGNQFVYIPVDYISNDLGRINEEEGTTYFGKRNFGGQDDEYENYKETLPKELVDSIEKYNGFYAGRYESSTKFESSSDGKTTTKSAHIKAMANKPEVMIEAGRSDAKDVSSDKLYNYVDFDSATTIVKNLFPNVSMITPHIPYGSEWDTVVMLLSDLGIRDDLSVMEWGNFYDSDIAGYKLNGEAKPLNAAITMQTMRFNLFDFAGNLWEMTNEKVGDHIVIRGGSYDSLGKLQTTSYRKKVTKESVVSRNIGFRPFMYIK